MRFLFLQLSALLHWVPIQWIHAMSHTKWDTTNFHIWQLEKHHNAWKAKQRKGDIMFFVWTLCSKSYLYNRIFQRQGFCCVFYFYNYLKKQQSCIWYIELFGEIPRIYWDKKIQKKKSYYLWLCILKINTKVVKIEPSGRQQVGQPAGGKWYLLHLFGTLKKKKKS